jgi:hypothetical protein
MNYGSIYKRSFIHSGQSLIEIVAALGILIILISISTIAVITALNNSQHSKSQNQATIYAQTGIEILRQMRDSSWASFDNLSGSYCLSSNCAELTSNGACGVKNGSCGLNVDSVYSREVLIEKNSTKCTVGASSFTKATVSVSWSDNKCVSPSDYCRKVIIETCLADINRSGNL